MNSWLDATEGQIRHWAFDSDPMWPEIDFDIAIAQAGREKLIFELAADPACPQSGFFLN
jgi:hypothetical protein